VDRSCAEGVLVEAPRGVGCGKGVACLMKDRPRRGLDPPQKILNYLT